MEIIKCKICGKLFYKFVGEQGTCSNFMYDYDACEECNKKAKENSK